MAKCCGVAAIPAPAYADMGAQISISPILTMSSNVVRSDLVVPYHHIPAKPRTEASGMIAQSLPMAAMFMRNKLLSWASLFLAIQSYLNEPINGEKPADAQPPFLRIVFAIVSLFTCYMDLVFPNTGTAPKSSLANAASSVTSAVSSATK